GGVWNKSPPVTPDQRACDGNTPAGNHTPPGGVIFFCPPAPVFKQKKTTLKRGRPRAPLFFCGVFLWRKPPPPPRGAAGRAAAANPVGTTAGGRKEKRPEARALDGHRGAAGQFGVESVEVIQLPALSALERHDRVAVRARTEADDLQRFRLGGRGRLGVL